MSRAIHSRSQGQALILVIVVLGALVMSLLVSYSVGRVVAARVKLMQAADNAAWSAATYQARIMNYMSYMNRAMIVNHVTAAQAVTAAGFTRYQMTTANNLCTAFCWVPYLGQFLKGVDQYVTQADRVVQQAAPVLMHGVNLMNMGLQASQQAVWTLAELEMPRLASEVARANESHALIAQIPLQQAVAEYARWTHRYDSEGERWRFGRTVSDARDSWTARRNHDGLRWLRHSILGARLVRNFRFSRRGGTELSDLQRWETTDTLSLKFERPRWRGGVRWRDGEFPPIGWGSETSGNGNRNRSPLAYGNSGRDNPLSTSLAWKNQQDLSAGYRGIPSYIDLAADHREDTLAVVVEAYIPASAVATANQPGSTVKAGPTLKMRDSFVGSHISSISRADTFFERPHPRRDGSEELASTFNPYWQARLRPASPTQLLFNDILMGRGLISLTPWIAAENGSRH